MLNKLHILPVIERTSQRHRAPALRNAQFALQHGNTLPVGYLSSDRDDALAERGEAFAAERRTWSGSSVSVSVGRPSGQESKRSNS